MAKRYKPVTEEEFLWNAYVIDTIEGSNIRLNKVYEYGYDQQKPKKVMIIRDLWQYDRLQGENRTHIPLEMCKAARIDGFLSDRLKSAREKVRQYLTHDKILQACCEDLKNGIIFDNDENGDPTRHDNKDLEDFLNS